MHILLHRDDFSAASFLQLTLLITRRSKWSFGADLRIVGPRSGTLNTPYFQPKHMGSWIKDMLRYSSVD